MDLGSLKCLALEAICRWTGRTNGGICQILVGDIISCGERWEVFMRSAVLMAFVLAGLLNPRIASGADDSIMLPHPSPPLAEEHDPVGLNQAVTKGGFPLIETSPEDPECVQECLRRNQQVSVGYEELERRCRESCLVTRALQLVESVEPEEYAEGVRILCDSDDRRAVEPLIAALRRDLEERTGSWAWIIPALGALRDSAAIPVLTETLEIPDDDWLGREMSARALGDIGDPSAIPALTAAAWRGDTRDDAIMALARIPNSDVAPVLVSALDPGEDPETREAAMDGLEWLGWMAVPALVEALGEYSSEHPETDRRVWICQLLGDSGDADALEVLRAHRNDPDPLVAACVARFTTE